MGYIFSGYKERKFNVGQFRLLKLIAKMYNVEPEDIVNQLVQNYNELHLDELIATSAYSDNIAVKSLDVIEFGKALEKKPEIDFNRKIKASKNVSAKMARERQTQSLDEALDALHRM